MSDALEVTVTLTEAARLTGRDRSTLARAASRGELDGSRHTHASLLLLEQGTDVAAVSERLGHFSVAVTMGLYAHAVAGRQKLAAESLGRMLAG